MPTTLESFRSDFKLTTTLSSLVQTNSTEKKLIGVISLTNTSDSNVEVTLWRIAESTSATDGSGGNWSYKKTIPAKKSAQALALVGQVLGNSMKIEGLADTDGVINVDISGTTET